MTQGIIGQFRIGEDMVLALDAVSGDPAAASAVTAAIRPAFVGDNRLVLDPNALPLGMAVASQADPAAGWTVSLPAAQTAVLAPGLYGIDARLSVGGGVEITDRTAFVSLTRAAL